MAFAPTEQLGFLLSTNPSATSAEAKTLLNRLSVEVKKRAVQGATTSYDFLASALAVLGQIRGAAHGSLRATCLWEIGGYFQVCGHQSLALQVARQMESLALKMDDKAWLRKSSALAGMAEAEMGDLGGALLHYERALDLSREESTIAEIASLINLGTALNYCSLHREAIPCFQRANQLARSDQNLPDADLASAVALGNMAQSHLFLEEFRKGLDTIRLAVADSVEPSDGRAALSRTTREWTFVQLALEMGMLDEARIHAAECRKYGQWGSNPRALFLADIAHGLCEVFGGDVSKGLHVLELTLARSIDDSQREDALRALVKAHDEVGHDDQALDYLRQLRSQLRTRGERAIVALLAQGSLSSDEYSLPGCAPDFQALEIREAKLRTRIAERDALSSRIEMLERLAVTADLKEEASGEHGYRVGKLSSLLAEAMGLPPTVCSAIELAARLHDIGKIAIPDRILLASERLRDAERDLMSAHALIGAELLAKSQIPQLRMAEEIARCHHEWWDGTGYPAKLKGQRIPLDARIVAIADVFDALTHDRVYAPAWSIEDALEEITRRRGTQFDPDLVDRFVKLIGMWRTLHSDLDEYLGRAGRNSPFARARQRIRAMLSEGGTAVRHNAFEVDAIH